MLAQNPPSKTSATHHHAFHSAADMSRHSPPARTNKPTASPVRYAMSAVRVRPNLNVCSRGTNLRTLNVQVGDDIFEFQGQGAAPDSQVRSMQQQLAALRTTSQFLAPTTWPAHGCLTRLGIDALFPWNAQHNQAILLPSLVDLRVHRICADDPFTCLLQVSTLSRLTSLALLGPGLRALNRHGALWQSIARLPALRRLAIDGNLVQRGSSPISMLPGWGALPDCVSQLQTLEAFHLESCPLELTQLSKLGTIKELRLSRVLAMGKLASLFVLPHLTSLEAGESYGGGLLGDILPAAPVAEVPARWREGMRHLSWGEWSDGSLCILGQLTSICGLEMIQVKVSPQLCR
jgi:hypothetical protein